MKIVVLLRPVGCCCCFGHDEYQQQLLLPPSVVFSPSGGYFCALSSCCGNKEQSRANHIVKLLESNREPRTRSNQEQRTEKQSIPTENNELTLETTRNWKEIGCYCYHSHSQSKYSPPLKRSVPLSEGKGSNCLDLLFKLTEIKFMIALLANAWYRVICVCFWFQFFY